ncbi:MAG: hypothetical protein LIR46_04405 [Bacteroidota bacterium]|nr:hypothetical protein [Bacteroidota bacterium]
MAFDVTVQGASYPDVPSVILPQTGGGNAKFYAMNDSMAWLGADAKLVETFTLSDVTLANTDFATWTPSTTAIDILATRTAGTFVADCENYDYYIISQTSIPVVVDDSAVKKALPILTAANQVQMIIRRPNNWAQITNESFVIQVCVTAYSSCFMQYYGTTTGTASYTWGASYGLYSAVTPAVLSSNASATPTITVKTPKVTARCSTTYMSTANAALIDQDKTIISQKCLVYRVKLGTGCMRGIYEMNTKFINDVRVR